MNIKKLLSAVIITLISTIFIANSESRAESSSSDTFLMDFGDIVSDGGHESSTSFQFQGRLPGIEVLGSSNNYQTNSVLYTPTAAVVDNCGNDTIDSGETCDGSNFGGQSCSSYGYDSGSLSCNSSCQIVSSACYNAPVELDDTGGGGGHRGGPTSGPTPSEPPQPEEPMGPPEPTEPTEPTTPTEPTAPTEPTTPTEPTESTEPVLSVETPSEPIPVPVGPIYYPPYYGPTYEVDPDILVGPGDTQEYITPDRPINGIGNTTDQTPVVSDILRRYKEYKVAVVDPRGRLIETGVIDTDKDGQFVYEIRSQIKPGTAVRVYIIDPSQEKKVSIVDNKIIETVEEIPAGPADIATEINDKIIANYGIRVIDKTRPDIQITLFGDQQEVETVLGRIINLGHIEDTEENRYIEGRATPDVEIVAYFHSEIIIVTARADDEGYFKIKIPETVGSGQHSVDIVQEFPDGVRSENLTYQFELSTSGSPAIEFARAYEGDAVRQSITGQQVVSTNLIVFLLLFGALLLLVGAYVKEKYFK